MSHKVAEQYEAAEIHDRGVDPFASIRPATPFSIIYADPPWYYEGGSLWNRGGAGDHYETQGADWIARLPVAEVSAWNSVCFMWATYPRLPEALYVLRAWGFEYRTVAFTWIKVHASGSPFFGMGAYTRANAEICILGTRGQTLDRKNKGVPQIIQTEPYQHSVKPHEARERIVTLYGDVPRLEMFARRDPDDMFPPFDGWALWGNQS
jgi:N6-adenosine-specific RNA methylase IME4